MFNTDTLIVIGKAVADIPELTQEMINADWHKKDAHTLENRVYRHCAVIAVICSGMNPDDAVPT